jgi:hypothetical protein
MPSCVPPQSLATWSALLLCGAIALGVEALALLFTLRPARGGAWGWPALRGVLLACALAAAIWSLTIRASAEAIYGRYGALFEWNPDACLGGMHHWSPESYAAFMRNMQAVAAPTEHAAAIASGASVILLIAGAYILALWIRRRWRAAPQPMAGMESDEWRRERIV